MALVLLAFILPRETALERLLCLSLLAVQLPLGIAAGIYPGPLLSLARSAFFAGGFLMLAWVFWQRRAALPTNPSYSDGSCPT